MVSDGLERKRKQIKEKYSKMAKDLEQTSWMYPSVDEILQGKSKR